MTAVREFDDVAAEPAIRGFLHDPALANGDTLVLTHGAGGNCQSKLLTAVAEAFAEIGLLVLRCDLPFRQARPHGPPFPAMAARDREGLGRAVNLLKEKTPGRIFLGGHSYGGRQATMLAAEHADLVSGLLLLSYPLHPPRKPADLRTAHFLPAQHAVVVRSRRARPLRHSRRNALSSGADTRENVSAGTRRTGP